MRRRRGLPCLLPRRLRRVRSNGMLLLPVWRLLPPIWRLLCRRLWLLWGLGLSRRGRIVACGAVGRGRMLPGQATQAARDPTCSRLAPRVARAGFMPM